MIINTARANSVPNTAVVTECPSILTTRFSFTQHLSPEYPSVQPKTHTPVLLSQMFSEQRGEHKLSQLEPKYPGLQISHLGPSKFPSQVIQSPDVLLHLFSLQYFGQVRLQNFPYLPSTHSKHLSPVKCFEQLQFPDLSSQVPSIQPKGQSS